MILEKKIKKDLSTHLFLKMIGLIFGDTDFPNEILKTIKKNRIDYLIIDLSKKKILKRIKNHTKIPLVNLVKSLRS